MLSLDTPIQPAKADSLSIGAPMEGAIQTLDMAAQDHYIVAKIQPIEYIVANNLDFLEGNIVKYVSRYRNKNGVEDLKKARVYLDWLIEREETGSISVKQVEGKVD